MNTIRHIIEVCANHTVMNAWGEVDISAGECIYSCELEHAPEDVHALQAELDRIADALRDEFDDVATYTVII